MVERDISGVQIGGENGGKVRVNRLGKFYLGWHFQIGRAPEGIREFFRSEFLPSIQRGEIRSMAKDSKVLFAPYYERRIEGSENIPAAGPLVVINNHWSEGPLHAYWPHFLVNEVVAEHRDENEEVRWVMQDGLTIGRSRWRIPFTARFQRMIARTYGHFLVPPPSVRAAGHDVVNESMEIFRGHKKGETLAFSPEAEGSTYLKNGHYLAGELAYCLLKAQPDSMVCPVGVWSEGRNGHEILHVNFGKAFSLSDILIFGQRPRSPGHKKNFYEGIANYLVMTIDPLVPERYRLKNGRR